jgi:hypothetical protein
MPPKLIRVLNYSDPFYVRFNSAANYLVYAFKINTLFDVDPLILSGTISGFKEVMAFYTYFRVKKFRAHLEITNNEAFPVMWGIVFSPDSLVGVIANRDDAINALENDFSTRPKMLSAKGGIDKDKTTLRCDPEVLLGNSQQYNADVAYAGTVTTDPTRLLYMNVIIASPSATNLINGVTTTLTLNYTTQFFSRINLRS